MQFWIKRREKLKHHYSLVGYLLSPNPTIMAHAYDNRSDIHNNAVVKVITKLIIDPMLVEDERSRSLAESINTFWDEYGCFVNKQHMRHKTVRYQHSDGIRDILFMRQSILVSWHALFCQRFWALVLRNEIGSR